MKITVNKLIEKFEDKGISLNTLFFNLPPIPIFDPSCIELNYFSKEDLYDTFKKSNRWRFDYYNERLQELDTWIDYQQHQ